MVLERFHADELEDLLAGIGSGDIRINQLLNYLDTRYNKPTAEGKIAACWRSWSRRPTCRSGPSPRIT